MRDLIFLVLLFFISVSKFTANCLTLSVVSQGNVECHGGNDGKIAITASGGTAPFTYLWSNGQSDSAASGLTAGIYTCTVMDAGSCRDSIWVIVSQPDSMIASLSISEATCGAGNGSCMVTVSGGTGPFSYSWNNGATANIVTGLGPGVYSLSVTDSRTCTAMASAVIINVPGPRLAISGLTGITCFGMNNGSAIIAVIGGTPAFTFEWSTGLTGSNSSASDTLRNLAAAVYTFHVSDGNGCLADTTFFISEPPLLTSAAVSVNGSCGLSNGSAQVTVAGGIPGYTFSWSTGATALTSGLSAQLANLGSGIYTLTVTDNNGCTSSALVSLDNATALSLLISSQLDVSCNGLSDGSATVLVTSGTPSYSYSWSVAGAPASPVCSGLGAGIYTVTVSDMASCTQTTVVTITEPFLLTSGISKTDASCGMNDGIVNANATGGSSPYYYSWSNASTGDILSNLPAGSYIVTITDKKGCSTTASATLSNNTPPVAQASASLTTLEAGNTTTLTGTGGTTYEWLPVSSVTCAYCAITMASPMSTTTYSLIAIDGFGCSDTSRVTVTVDPACTGDAKDVFVANVFSPNGDGKNDEIKVEGNGLTNISWSVFDRWGNLVFFTEQQSQAWDGTDKGKPLNNGTYIYIFSATCKSNMKEINLKGTISILK